MIRSVRSKMVKFYDIALNLTDPMFFGVYHGKKQHDPDTVSVINRAYNAGVLVSMITGSSLKESRQAIELANSNKDRMKLTYTVGVHPCCVNEFMEHKEDSATIDNPSDDHDYNHRLYQEVLAHPERAVPRLRELYHLVKSRLDDPLFRAIGEMGLDYDRLNYSCKEMQLLFFEEQLKMSCIVSNHKPFFLHMRNCGADFLAIMTKFIKGFKDDKDMFNWKELIPSEQLVDGHPFYKLNPDVKFVVHSFTDSIEDMEALLASSPNCYIGMNGCSLRDEHNIDTVRKIPLDRLLLETDAPWCEIRRTHASHKYLEGYDSTKYKQVKKEKLKNFNGEELDTVMVKSRNEPCNMEQVAIVVANIKNLPLEEVADQVWKSSCEIYGE